MLQVVSGMCLASPSLQNFEYENDDDRNDFHIDEIKLYIFKEIKSNFKQD